MQGVMYLLDESKLGLIKCAMTVRGGWKLYQRSDAAVGGAVTAVAAPDGTLGMRTGASAPPEGVCVCVCTMEWEQ